jgi:hypothetical protein
VKVISALKSTAKENLVAIAVYMHPEGLTGAKYDEVHRLLVEAGHETPKGRVHHSCFGADGDLMVYNIWASQEDFDAFGPILGPILAQVGVTMTTAPDIMPIYDMD